MENKNRNDGAGTQVSGIEISGIEISGIEISGIRISSIEEAFAKLQEILSRMDEEGVTLEESFKCYEDGMKLIRYCNETIDTVEKKVQILSAEGETDEF